jgi:hypothetical protein
MAKNTQAVQKQLDKSKHPLQSPPPTPRINSATSEVDIAPLNQSLKGVPVCYSFNLSKITATSQLYGYTHNDLSVSSDTKEKPKKK